MEPTTGHPDKKTLSPRTVVGWGLVVLLVISAWVVAIDLRAGTSSEKVILDGWQDGLTAGKRIAEDQDRPMIVLFTASWCGPCQKFKHDVLTQPVVSSQLAENYVPVQVDLSDRSSKNPNMADANRYGVRGIPAIIAMDANGKTISHYPLQADNTTGSFLLWLDSVDARVSMPIATSGSR